MTSLDSSELLCFYDIIDQDHWSLTNNSFVCIFGSFDFLPFFKATEDERVQNPFIKLQRGGSYETPGGSGLLSRQLTSYHRSMFQNLLSSLAPKAKHNCS